MKDQREEIKKIILGLNLGYKYQSSDYATSKVEAENYERVGLNEVEDAVDKIVKLVEKEDLEIRGDPNLLSRVMPDRKSIEARNRQ